MRRRQHGIFLDGSNDMTAVTSLDILCDRNNNDDELVGALAIRNLLNLFQLMMDFIDLAVSEINFVLTMSYCENFVLITSM